MDRDDERIVLNKRWKLIPDARCANAYDSIPAHLRAAIKTAIALSYFHFNILPHSDLHEKKDNNLGFKTSSRSESLDWTLICIPANFSAAALMCAAAMLPVLAGVNTILVLAFGGQPTDEALVTLELCGIENKYYISNEEDCFDFLPEGTGKILFVHHGELNKLIDRMDSTGVSFINLNHDPTIIVKSDADNEMLKFAFGKNVKPLKNMDQKEPIEVISPSGNKLYPGKGCECMWLYDDITPECFRAKIWEFEMPGLL